MNTIEIPVEALQEIKANLLKKHDNDIDKAFDELSLGFCKEFRRRQKLSEIVALVLRQLRNPKITLSDVVIESEYDILIHRSRKTGVGIYRYENRTNN
jgi:hypothetical protein